MLKNLSRSIRNSRIRCQQARIRCQVPLNKMKTYDPLGNITTAGTSQATSTQVTAPTSYWKYDESSGVASDSTGSNTLTNNNTITYSAGKTNNASNLVAANSQWFSIANGTWSNLDPTTSFSLSFWLKVGPCTV